ncbi:MAG: ABC transporter permease [Bacilli bacterium]
MDVIEKKYAAYVKAYKQKERNVIAIQIMLVLLCLGLWELASVQQWIDPLLFSSPTHIASRIYEGFIQNTLLPHISVTLFETITAFVISIVAGFAIAGFLWWFPIVANVVEPFLVTLNALPKVALGPIIIIIFGPTLQSSIAMGVLVSIIITIIVLYNRFQETDENYLKLFRAFSAKRSQMFWLVVAPSAKDTMLSTLKVNVGLAWVGVIVGEFLVSKAGLGYLIVYGFQMFDSTLVLSSVVLICIMASGMYYVQVLMQRKLSE